MDDKFNPEKNIKNKNELAAYYLNRLKFIMAEYSDEIPTREVHSNDPDNEYKVRAAWWTSISLNMHGLKERKLISNEFVEEYHKIFNEHQKNLNETGLTKVESIEAVNELIKKVIKYLEDEEAK